MTSKRSRIDWLPAVLLALAFALWGAWIYAMTLEAKRPETCCCALGGAPYVSDCQPEDCPIHHADVE